MRYQTEGRAGAAECLKASPPIIPSPNSAPPPPGCLSSRKAVQYSISKTIFEPTHPPTHSPRPSHGYIPEGPPREGESSWGNSSYDVHCQPLPFPRYLWFLTGSLQEGKEVEDVSSFWVRGDLLFPSPAGGRVSSPWMSPGAGPASPHSLPDVLTRVFPPPFISQSLEAAGVFIALRSVVVVMGDTHPSVKSTISAPLGSFSPSV